MRGMTAAAIPAAARTDTVAAAPSAIFITIGFVIAADVAHSHGRVHTDTVHGASRQHRQRANSEHGCHPATASDVDFGSTLLSLSVRSLSPNGAPAGSATTATSPPWRST